jgi:hypothetical protein
MSADLPPVIPTHISMPINADGDGPEMDDDKVVDVICWSCLETWPCTIYREKHIEDS